MDYSEKSLKKHYEWKGKIEVKSRVPLETHEDLSLAYTPGVAAPCLEISRDKSRSLDLTRRGETVAVITDGTAVLGLGDIGPEAGLPVMEGKCALFKALGNVDAVPICIGSKDTDKIVETIHLISGSFGGINLEDISAPRCFEIERRLKELCAIPVFHDDQHGTAVVTLSAVINSLKLTGKNKKNVKTVINGAGAAGIGIARLLLSYGLENIIMCDSRGAVYKGRNDLNDEKAEAAEITNPDCEKGDLGSVIKGADIFIGVSVPGCLSAENVKAMAKDPILFPMANPDPEIEPSIAKAAGAAIVGTGRSDHPNQINNVLAFPGIFRGALDVRAGDINEAMEMAAAEAIAGYVKDNELSVGHIIPSPLDKGLSGCVAKAVADAAKKSGAAWKMR